MKCATYKMKGPKTKNHFNAPFTNGIKGMNHGRRGLSSPKSIGTSELKGTSNVKRRGLLSNSLKYDHTPGNINKLITPVVPGKKTNNKINYLNDERPTKETQKLIDDAIEGKNVEYYESEDAFFKELGI